MSPDEIARQNLTFLVERLKSKQLEEERKVLIAQQRSDAFGCARVLAQDSLDDLVEKTSKETNL